MCNVNITHMYCKIAFYILKCEGRQMYMRKVWRAISSSNLRSRLMANLCKEITNLGFVDFDCLCGDCRVALTPFYRQASVYCKWGIDAFECRRHASCGKATDVYEKSIATLLRRMPRRFSFSNKHLEPLYSHSMVEGGLLVMS